MQPLDPALDESPSPLADDRTGNTKSPGDGAVGLAPRAGQDNAGALDQTVRHGSRLRDGLELLVLFVRENQGRKLAGHDDLLCSVRSS